MMAQVAFDMFRFGYMTPPFAPTMRALRYF
jgi:hypothetical protein